MKILPPKTHRYLSPKIARLARCFSAICLVTTCLTLPTATAYAAIPHPPTISSIQDQAIRTGTQFMGPVFFRAWDKETTLSTANLTALVENDPASPNFYSTGSVQIDACNGDIGCPVDGTGYKLTFAPLMNGDGAATVRVSGR
jgi:hypothetical protein